MKIKSFLLIVAAMLLFSSTETNADLVVETAAPTTDLILGVGNGAANGGGSNQQAFAVLTNDANPAQAGNRGRGQSFFLDDAGGVTYDIGQITASLGNSSNNGANRPAGILTFTVFEYTGAGATAADQVEDSASFVTGTLGSSGTELFREDFAVAAGTTFSNADFLTVDFQPGELQLEDDTAYGFFYRYQLADTSELTEANEVTTSIAFDTRQDSNRAGFLLNSIQTGANGVSTPRDLNYFITGTVAVPEPTSLAVLGLGFLGFVTRRRR